MSSRVLHDYYPTPSACVVALGIWLARQPSLVGEGPWLDPAAGKGALLRHISQRAERIAIEIDPAHESDLRQVADDITVDDAIRVLWPRANVIANPPFCLLDDFWSKIAAHHLMFGVFAAVLMPVGWFNAQKRADYVRPEFILPLGFRSSFVVSGGSANQDHQWAVLSPMARDVTCWEVLPKPEVA